jgi:hypothetical protein
MFHEVGMARSRANLPVHFGLANFPVAYCGLKIITSLRSVSLIFSECLAFFSSSTLIGISLEPVLEFVLELNFLLPVQTSC